MKLSSCYYIVAQNATKNGGDNMPNEKKIKAKIMEEGLTIAKISSEMGITAYTLGQKILGKSPMTIHEARFLQQKLKISDNEIVSYFFN